MHVSEMLHNHDDACTISSDPQASGAAVSSYSLPTRRLHVSRAGLWQAALTGKPGQVCNLTGLPRGRRVHVVHLQVATNHKHRTLRRCAPENRVANLLCQQMKMTCHIFYKHSR